MRLFTIPQEIFRNPWQLESFAQLLDDSAHMGSHISETTRPAEHPTGTSQTIDGYLRPSLGKPVSVGQPNVKTPTEVLAAERLAPIRASTPLTKRKHPHLPEAQPDTHAAPSSNPLAPDSAIESRWSNRTIP